MKILIHALVSAMIAASLAGSVIAAPSRSKKHPHRQHIMAKPTLRPAQGSGDYYEHLLNKVPFGSQRWWSIYHEQQGVPN